MDDFRKAEAIQRKIEDDVATCTTLGEMQAAIGDGVWRATVVYGDYDPNITLDGELIQEMLNCLNRRIEGNIAKFSEI